MAPVTVKPSVIFSSGTTPGAVTDMKRGRETITIVRNGRTGAHVFGDRTTGLSIIITTLPTFPDQGDGDAVVENWIGALWDKAKKIKKSVEDFVDDILTDNPPPSGNTNNQTTTINCGACTIHMTVQSPPPA